MNKKKTQYGQTARDMAEDREFEDIVALFDYTESKNFLC